MFVSYTTLLILILIAYLLGLITTPLMLFMLVLRPAGIQAESKQASNSTRAD